MKNQLETFYELYKIGRGPSSSHTIGPYRAVQWYIKKHPDVKSLTVTLYGSLSLTGKGHLTDVSLKEAADPIPLEIVWDLSTKTDHPNIMDIEGFNENKKSLERVRIISRGGGTWEAIGYDVNARSMVYPHSTFEEIKAYIKKNNMTLIDYVKKFDSYGYAYLTEVLKAMDNSVEAGIDGEGLFNGPIKMSKLTKKILNNLKTRKFAKNSIYWAMAYAYSAAEINVQHGIVVTSPTLGSAGIFPAVLYWCRHNLGYDEETLINMLAVGGIIGILFKKHGTIAGATGGCQAECGCACAMAAAGYAWSLKGTIEEIEAAAIIAEEHHLGLTCDAVLGHVYVPCIERNGVMAMRAIQSAEHAMIIDGVQEVLNIDDIIIVENRTGEDLKPEYRETGMGGLSLRWKEKNKHPLDNND
ncbi:MAG: L-serine ammonia-lyase, iron-sulfur-dependent, subunit alpha [Malacoplasma sp.]|nr:L-serine ammonia-lyase, iron-sulfur-dependent, subunit alpha [Malacoplasma sp.]